MWMVRWSILIKYEIKSPEDNFPHKIVNLSTAIVLWILNEHDIFLLTLRCSYVAVKRGCFSLPIPAKSHPESQLAQSQLLKPLYPGTSLLDVLTMTRITHFQVWTQECITWWCLSFQTDLICWQQNTVVTSQQLITGFRHFVAQLFFTTPLYFCFFYLVFVFEKLFCIPLLISCVTKLTLI